MRLTLLIASMLVLYGCAPARSAECPVGIPKCKVLILTPEEETALTQPNGILDTAEKGAYVQLGGVIRYFREKIEKAPPGELAKTPDKK